MSDAEQPKDNIISFPQIRRAAPPEAPDEADITDDFPELTDGDGQESLDAFERAVRQAVNDKLTGTSPRGADELVAQVFSALTGRDEQSALEEVRARMDEESMGKVIDLNSVREAREREAQDAAARVKGALKEGFQQLLASIAARTPQGAQGEIKLDAQFFKQHGNAILGTLFTNLATALGQSATAKTQALTSSELTDAQDDTPAPAPESEPTETSSVDAAETPLSPNTPVQVKLDLGSLLGAFFRKVTKVPPPADS